MRTTIVCCAIVCLGLAAPALSAAQDLTKDTGAGPARVFGHDSQLTVSSDAAFSVSGDSTVVQFGPSVDYFIAHNVSIGGMFGVNYTQARDSDTTGFLIGPRVGYNFAFTDRLGVWPKIGFGYSHYRVSAKYPGVNEDVIAATSGGALALNLSAPIVFHPIPHVFAGFGPYLDTELTGSDRITTFGARLTLGGWLET